MSVLKVNIANGETFEQIAIDVWLDDAIPDDDERFFVEQQLRANGRCWVGGGAAPLFYLTPVRS